MKWYTLISVDISASDEIVLKTEVGPESPWFSGHFPGEPVLPGVAQLKMVLDAARRLRGGGIRIAGVKRIRFRRVIRPDERLTITVTPHKRDLSSYPFRITVDGEVASRGVLVVEESDG